MNALDRLILMVPSLTKAEKRAFTITQKGTDYLLLYQLILKNQQADSKRIELLYKKKRPNSNILVTALYLMDRLLEVLCNLEEKKNVKTQLLKKINIARVLMKKSFFDHSLEVLNEVKTVSKQNKLNEIFLFASQAELDILLKTDFVGMSEKELSKRHRDVEEAIKAIWKSEGVASLYDLMKYRTYHYDIMRSEEQRKSLNDLLTSELTINSSQGEMNFEAMKFHQLFQATYLMGVHDYTAALRALKELINLFKRHPHIWEYNQYYYVEAVETALQSLRYSKQYESIDYFISQLDEVWANNRVVKSYIDLLTYQYKIIPYIDRGLFAEAHTLIQQYITEGGYEKLAYVNLDKQAELHLYAAIVSFGMGNFQRVREILTPLIFQTKIYAMLPIMRTIRLLHLMTLYELDCIADYDFEIHSFKRKLQENKRAYKMETLLVKFINHPRTMKSTKKEWSRWEEPINKIRNDVYERQLLNIFDFTKWIEAKVTGTNLCTLLAQAPTNNPPE